MVCAECRRLEQRYNAALRRWAQYVRPQAIVPLGKDQLERSKVLRQKALIERDSASDILIGIAALAYSARHMRLSLTKGLTSHRTEGLWIPKRLSKRSMKKSFYYSKFAHC